MREAILEGDELGKELAAEEYRKSGKRPSSGAETAGADAIDAAG